MIGRLTGRLDSRGPDHVLVDVGGVGYVVFVSERTMAALPAPGSAVTLYTDLQVREDLLQLFGFSNPQEREWHRLLIGVQGVGAKSSIAILGTLGAAGVGRAVAMGDWAAIKAAPTVGPKIAQRVVNELKDKAAAVMAMGGAAPDAPAPDDAPEGAPEGANAPPPAGAADAGASAQAEALSALGNLGYGPSEAARAVAAAAGADGELDTAGLVRAALKLLAPPE